MKRVIAAGDNNGWFVEHLVDDRIVILPLLGVLDEVLDRNGGLLTVEFECDFAASRVNFDQWMQRIGGRTWVVGCERRRGAAAGDAGGWESGLVVGAAAAEKGGEEDARTCEAMEKLLV